MTEDGWDVNVEYEKLFGSSKRINLFDTEEEYYELRKFVIDQSLENYIFDGLPFDGIELVVKKEVSKSIKERIATSPIIIEEKSLKEPQISQDSIVASERHLFYIEEKGVCYASGYYDEENTFFYICKDSLVSYETDLLYLANDKEKARNTFLNKICEEERGYYKVLKDAKCRNASAAACYVLGRQADYTYWRDNQGKTLLDIYPNDSFPHTLKVIEPDKDNNSPRGKVKVSRFGRLPRYYYLARNMGKRSCNAKGMYDKANDKFIILEGSILADEVISSYRYTASDIKRNKFIQLNCYQTKEECKMKRDAICSSPNEAASFVLGENANGLEEWKSKEGISLSYYIDRMK